MQFICAWTYLYMLSKISYSLNWASIIALHFLVWRSFPWQIILNKNSIWLYYTIFTLSSISYLPGFCSHCYELLLLTVFTSLIHCKLLFSHYHFYSPVNHFSSSLKGLILLYPLVEFFFIELPISTLLGSFLIVLSEVHFMSLKTLTAVASPSGTWLCYFFPLWFYKVRFK